MVDPATHAYPALQLPEHVDATNPVEFPYEPPSHRPLHAAVDRPVVDPYTPAEHVVHAPAPATLNRPTEHIAAAAVVDPDPQKYPAVQGAEHAAMLRPVALPYRPAEQLLHTLAPDTLY